MQGASRDALERLRERLAERAGADADRQRLADELLGVAAVLGREAALRNALTAAGTPPESRADLAGAVLEGRVGATTADLVRLAAKQRWSHARDLADAVEALGAEVTFAVAEDDGRLDRVEDELFRLARTVAAQPSLRRVLDDPAVPGERKAAVVGALIGDRADASTLALVQHVVASRRGRHVEDALAELVEQAARRRNELVAEVTTAAPMTAEQDRRMAAVLGRVYGRPVRLQTVVDEAIVGGAVVRVGEEVIDGSVVNRLEQARRDLAG